MMEDVHVTTDSRRVVFERKFSLKKAVVKMSTWRIASRSIVFPIVEAKVKDSWSSVPSTVQFMSRTCVLWLHGDLKNGSKPLDITAVI